MPLNKWQLKAILITNIVNIVFNTVDGFHRECIGVDKISKFVVSHDNCAKYIYCDGVNSFEGECLGDYYFNVNDERCHPRAEVQCDIDDKINDADSKEVVMEDGERTDANLSKTNSIQNYTNSKENEINKNDIIDQQQVKQQISLSVGLVGTGAVMGLAQYAIDMGNTGINAATTPAPAPSCPLRYGQHNTIYLPNTQSCSSYYICYNGILIPMICPRYNYFNEGTTRCEHQDKLYCPYNRPVRLICNPGVYDYIPHLHNCGYYYLCSNGYMIILQCPFNFAWHYERRSCVHRSHTKCFTGAIAQAMLNSG